MATLLYHTNGQLLFLPRDTIYVHLYYWDGAVLGERCMSDFDHPNYQI
jgi:hypothetical protein